MFPRIKQYIKIIGSSVFYAVRAERYKQDKIVRGVSELLGELSEITTGAQLLLAIAVRIW
jgi:hypothetical protein